MRPKQTKYKKYYKPRRPSKTITNPQELKPPFALELMALEAAHITDRQLESARQTIRRKIKRKGKLQILVYPDIGISQKSSAARMGKGKGKTSHWITKLKAGKPIFQLIGINFKEGSAALKAGSNKLPLHLKILKK